MNEENFHRFALSALRGEPLEREGEREREMDQKHDKKVGQDRKALPKVRPQISRDLLIQI